VDVAINESRQHKLPETIKLHVRAVLLLNIVRLPDCGDSVTFDHNRAITHHFAPRIHGYDGSMDKQKIGHLTSVIVAKFLK
jgi:hypothetical protein